MFLYIPNPISHHFPSLSHFVSSHTSSFFFLSHFVSSHTSSFFFCSHLSSRTTTLHFRSHFPPSFYIFFLFHSQPQGKHGGCGRGTGLPVSGVSRSGCQIHLPQTLSEERSRDELSDWEQVSSRAAERFAPHQPVPRLPIHCSAVPPSNSPYRKNNPPNCKSLLNSRIRVSPSI